MKKIVSLALSFVMACSLIVPVIPVNATTAEDSVSGHWSAEYLLEMYDLGVMYPTNSGAFEPDATISRAEFMRYVNRLFNHIDTTEISFTDVTSEDWYYTDVSKAVANGYMQGDSDTIMRPTSQLTRQEAVVILSRLHDVDESSTTTLTFTDADDIADWASPYVSYAVSKGYVSGRTDGTFDPGGYITYGEIAKILYYLGGNIFDEGTHYQSDLNSDIDNVTVRADYETTTLKNMDIDGDLYITAGAIGSTVVLDNVTIDGTLIIFGNDVTVEMYDVICDEVLTSYKSQTLIVEDDTEILNVRVKADTSIFGDGVSNVIDETEEANVNIWLSGEFRDVVITNETNLELDDVDIAKLYVLATAVNTEITLDSSSYIDIAELRAATSIYGGTVYELYIKSNGSVIDSTNARQYISSGYTVQINGQILSSGEVASSDLSVIVDSSSYISDKTVTFTFDSSEVLRLTYNGKELTADEDYRLGTTSLTFYSEFLETINESIAQVTIVMNDSENITANILFVDYSQNGLSTYELDYDKYNNASDAQVTLVCASDVTLSSIYYGGYYELDSTEYFVSNNIVYISSDYLSSLANGKAIFTFKMSDLNDLQLTINISDETPPNALSISSITFDTNIASPDYSDIVVEVLEEEGYFQGVYKGSTALVKNTDYTVSGSTITIKREYIIGLGLSNSDIELTFIMSKGDSPTLEVNITTTYPVEITVYNENGLLLENVNVTCYGITYVTDKNGVASLNLGYGTHAVTLTKTGYNTLSSNVYVSATYQTKTFTMSY